jgi:hypothetical protein
MKLLLATSRNPPPLFNFGGWITHDLHCLLWVNGVDRAMTAVKDGLIDGPYPPCPDDSRRWTTRLAQYCSAACYEYMEW